MTTPFCFTSGEDLFLPRMGTAEGDAPDEPDGHRRSEGFRYDSIWGNARAMKTAIDASTSDDLTAEWCEWMDWIDTDFPNWTEEDLAWIDELD